MLEKDLNSYCEKSTGINKPVLCKYNQCNKCGNNKRKPINTNFLKLIEILHQSLVDANLNDEQFDIIWSAINEAYSKIKL